MHAAGDDAVPKGIRRDDASAARPKKKSAADATQPPPLARAATTPAACTAAPAAAAPSSSEKKITDLEGLRRHIDGRLDAMSESMLRSAVDAAAQLEQVAQALARIEHPPRASCSMAPAERFKLQHLQDTPSKN